MQTTTRPAFNTNGLPEAVKARATAKADASWCYVTPDGRAFYVSEAQVRSMQAREGGSIFPPAA